MRKFLRRYRTFGRLAVLAIAAAVLVLAVAGQALAAAAPGSANSGDVLTQDQMWTTLVGAGLPPLIAVIQQAHWSSRLKSFVALAICTVVSAVAVVLIDNHWDWGNWVKSLLTVFIGAQVAYHAFWKPTGIAPAIERST